MMGRSCGGSGLRWPAEVTLVLIDGDERREIAMTRESRGYHCAVRDGVREGQLYAYRLDGGPERPDPCSLWQPEGVDGPSAVVFPGPVFLDRSRLEGSAPADLVFYEIHVGTFTPEGTFDAIIPRLKDLRELGITAIEIMPVGQFPGSRNWGYDGVLPYAAQNTYGGPHGLQRLVDACHAHGLAIYLDVVYNHFGPESNYLASLALTSPTATRRRGATPSIMTAPAATRSATSCSTTCGCGSRSSISTACGWTPPT